MKRRWMRKMKKYFIIIILLAFILLTLNSSASQEIDNTTDVNDSILKISNDTQVLQTSKETTHIDVSSKTNFDVIGDYFKVKLTDNNDKPISNVKITFTVNTKNYNINTDSLGIASLQLRLDDGSYKIVSKFSEIQNIKLHLSPPQLQCPILVLLMRG